MNNTEKATPRPWRLEWREDDGCDPTIIGANDRAVADVYESGSAPHNQIAESHANAELIVRAVNAHDALLAAAEAALRNVNEIAKRLVSFSDQTPIGREANRLGERLHRVSLIKLEAAIQAAKGEER